MKQARWRVLGGCIFLIVVSLAVLAANYSDPRIKQRT